MFIKASPGNMNYFYYDPTIVIPGKHLGRSHVILTPTKLNRSYFYIKCANSNCYSALLELTPATAVERAILNDLLREYHPEFFI